VIRKCRGIVESEKFRLFFSTFLYTLGIYLSFPEKGLIATIPLAFLWMAAGFALFPKGKICFVSVGLISFFYGIFANLRDPFLFALFSLISAVGGVLLVKGIRLLLRKKTALGAVLSLAALVAGVASTLVYQGTPTAHWEARDRFREYLSSTYPDQTFTDLTVHYDLRGGGYRGIVYYPNENNTLSSDLFLDENGVQDGFLQDFARWMLDIRKSDLIVLFNSSAPHAVVFDSEGFTEEGKSLSVYQGAFGDLREEMIPMMHYSATFRKECVSNKSFIEAVKESLLFLQKENVVFGEITFYGEDNGERIYSCTVTPETDPEEIVYLSRILKEQAS